MAKVDGVSSFTSKIMNYSSKALGAISKSKPIKWIGDEFQKNPEKALAYSTVASIVVKDGVGCYKYVTQSLNNKEIPEKRRNFVAALDLTNGVLMIAAQIAMFFAMRKFSEPIFNKIFKKSFNPQNAENIASRIRMEQKSNKQEPIRKLLFDKEYAKVRKDALDLFKFIADIAAATIIGKRVIVPFIATPLANVVKDKMEAKNKSEAIEDAQEEKEEMLEEMHENNVVSEAKELDEKDLKQKVDSDDVDHEEEDDDD